MSWGAIVFSSLAAAAVFSFIHAGFLAGREVAVWNWVARGRSVTPSKGRPLLSLLSLLGGMQEVLPGVVRTSRWLYERAAEGLGEEDPGPGAWLAAKEISALAAAFATFLLLSDWALAVIAGLGGFWFPDLVVRDRHLRKQERIRGELPDALDLLSLAVEGGMSLDAAFAQIGGKFEGTLISQALRRMLGEIRFGARRHQAWREMAARLGSQELREVTAALIEADALGVGLADAIKGLAGQMRIRRRQQIEELAHKAPVKMLFPLVLCIFPAVFVILLGPVILQLLAIVN